MKKKIIIILENKFYYKFKHRVRKESKEIVEKELKLYQKLLAQITDR